MKYLCWLEKEEEFYDVDELPKVEIDTYDEECAAIEYSQHVWYNSDGAEWWDFDTVEIVKVHDVVSGKEYKVEVTPEVDITFFVNKI